MEAFMKKSQCYATLITALIFSLFSPLALACKMTPMGGSTAMLKAVIDSINENPDLKDSNIVAIQQKQTFSDTYVVKIFNSGANTCQFIGYQATIQPSCDVSVKQFPIKFPCKIPEVKKSPQSLSRG